MATATFNTAVNSAAATVAGSAISHITIQDLSSGDGRILAKVSISLAALALGQSYAHAVDDIVITLTAGANGNDEGARELLEALVNNQDLYIVYHTADPVNDGSANESAQPASRTTLSQGVANWTVAAA